LRRRPPSSATYCSPNHLCSLTPRHPGPTLFPYTTLFRSPLPGQMGPSRKPLSSSCSPIIQPFRPLSNVKLPHNLFLVTFKLVIRSEEHTSELQSRENLVCRLLLEKKKHPPCATTRCSPRI